MLGSNKEFDNFTTRNIIYELNHAIFGNFGNFLTNCYENFDILKYGIDKLDQFIDGGIQQGKIYELLGASLN